jgi:hypothetical protein
MMTSQKDSRIDTYIETLPLWQQIICKQVRNMVHAADSQVEETIKRAKLPYFVLKGNICALQATKDHINIFIYDPVASDPEGIINQGQGNATARGIQVYEQDTFNEQAFLNLCKTIIARNKAGGWRKLLQ